MYGGTSIVFKAKIINICGWGSFIFYPDELRCEPLNENFYQKFHSANLYNGIILIFGGINESALLRGLNAETG